MRSLVGAVCLLLLACRPGSRVQEVTIRDFRFAPETVQVRVGDTIRWGNRDIVAHTATDTLHGWDSGAIAANATGQVVLETEGTHAYLCTLHPTMQGVIQVR